MAVAVVDPASAPPISVHPNKKHYVYRYFPPGVRKPVNAKAIADVPAASRDLVLVVPDDVEAPAGLAYVADLRAAQGDGSFPYKVVATAELERTLDESRPVVATAKPAQPAPTAKSPGSKPASSPIGAPTAPTARQYAADDKVTLYSTTWCGVCKQAKRWLENKGIPYVEKDVEETDGVREEMLQHADEAGVPRGSITGVPVIWVKRRLLTGFNPAAIERLLGT